MAIFNSRAAIGRKMARLTFPCGHFTMTICRGAKQCRCLFLSLGQRGGFVFKFRQRRFGKLGVKLKCNHRFFPCELCLFMTSFLSIWAIFTGHCLPAYQEYVKVTFAYSHGAEFSRDFCLRWYRPRLGCKNKQALGSEINDLRRGHAYLPIFRTPPSSG